MLALKLANYLIGALVAIVLARHLGVEAYGSYSFVYALVLVLAVPTGVGLPALVLRETAKAMQTHDHAVLWQLWRWASLAIMFAALIVMTGAALITLVFGYGATTPEVFWIGMLLVPLIAVGAVRGAALQALNRPFAAQFPQMVLRQGLHLVLFLLFALTAVAGAPSPTMAMALNVAAAVVAFSVGAYLLFNVAPPVDHSLTVRNAPHRSWLKASALIGTANGGQIINNNLDLILLGMLATVADVGLYKAVVVIGTTTLFAVSAIEQAIMPRVATLAAEGKMQQLASAARRAARQILTFGILIVLLLVALGHTILGLTFGAEYQQGYHVLLVVALAKSSFYLFGPVRPLLNMTGNEAAIPSVMFQAVALNAGACLVLIPLLGYQGAAIAMFLSSWYWNIRLFLVVRQKLGFNCWAFSR